MPEIPPKLDYHSAAAALREIAEDISGWRHATLSVTAELLEGLATGTWRRDSPPLDVPLLAYFGGNRNYDTVMGIDMLLDPHDTPEVAWTSLCDPDRFYLSPPLCWTEILPPKDHSPEAGKMVRPVEVR